MYKGITLIYSLEVLKCKAKWIQNSPLNSNASGANYSHEEGVTSSLSLAPPYYVYTTLLSSHPLSFLLFP